MSAVSSRTQKLIAAGAIVALALLSVQAFTLVTTGALNTAGIHAASGTTDPLSNSTITVTGSGQVTIQPTMALVTIGVNTQDASAQTAAQQNANIMTSVISALEGLGINSSDIQTISYNVYQQQNYPAQPIVCSPPVNSTVCGKLGTTYEVDNEVQVTVTVSSGSVSQLGAKAGAAIDAAVGAGANQVYGVQFSASSTAMQQAQQQALQLAVKDASAQATAVASALNVTVTGVVSVTTSPGYSPSPILYATAQAAAGTPIQTQTLTVSASVQAVYAIS